MAVKKGDKIKVEYTGTLDDGTVFDSSERPGQPLEFEVGSGQIIPGFDKGVVGMEKGDEKEIKIKPAEAYGEKNPQMVQKVPKERLPPGVKEGSVLILKAPNGAQIPVQVTKLDDKEATVDMNHPLAGKTLTFKIKIVDIS
ncbi:peptidylprolyl isomerase [Candidatus Woesearchaeota archaeon]|nr:peptidylprolyl isomerase [Candidatus Woesearchaeota archaeon]